MRLSFVCTWHWRVLLGMALPFTFLFAATAVQAQPRVSYERSQGVSPAFEGWTENADGSFEIVFGYMNRNWEEELHIPVGPDNYFSIVPAGQLNDLAVSGFRVNEADRGQPTYFLPRRNRFTFSVTVPASFLSSGMELVWTLTAAGVTERAYATLVRDYRIDNIVIMSETGSLGAGSSNPRIRSNEPPVVQLETPTQVTVRAGEPVSVVALVTDDGIPGGNPSSPPQERTPQQALERALSEPRRITVGKTDGLYVSWHVYRGPGQGVQFDPPQVKPWEDTRAFANSPWASFWTPPVVPADNRYPATVTFAEPGTYVLRARADDGGLFTDVEVTVQVLPPTL